MLLAVLFAGVVASSAATPAPTPTPTATPGLSLSGSGSNVFIDQATWGPGQRPPEGAAFASGEPSAPMSPYDWFSTNPLVPGVAAQVQDVVDLRYRWHGLTADALAVASALTGSVTNGIYWGEPFAGPFDPHEGRSHLPYRIVFPTQANSDDALGGGIALPYAVSLGKDDGSWKISGGYVAPSQYDGFVFTQPPLTSWIPSLGVPPLESVGPGGVDLADWQHLATALPLLGVDATASAGKLTFEATDALLPMPAGNGARLFGVRAGLTQGTEVPFAVDWVNVNTWGAPVTAPVLYGADPHVHRGAQGGLATSVLGNQRETIAGARAFVHPLAQWDLTLEFGRTWYATALMAQPGGALPGNYEHAALARHFGPHADAGAEYYRFDPRYGQAYLPYGIPENVFGIAWAYPGPWLKGAYQLVQNGAVTTNRLGLRSFADWTSGRFEAHAAYYAYRQVEPSTFQNLLQPGFVEVDYQALTGGDVMLGQTHGAQAYLAWHFPHDTLAAEAVRDTEYRPYSGNAAGDLVDMRYAQFVFSEEHRIGDKLAALAGYARYGASGMWSTTPVDGIEAFGFAGVEWEFAPGQQLLVQVRRYGVVGLPSIPGNVPPTLRGTSFVVDHHFIF